MLLDLKPILVTPGASLPFETSEDLSDLVFGSCKPADEPVLARGKVRNTAGVLKLTGELSTTLHGVCDRCAAAFTRAITIPVHAVLVPEQELEQAEDEWTFGIHDGCADLTDIVTTAFVLMGCLCFAGGRDSHCRRPARRTGVARRRVAHPSGVRRGGGRRATMRRA